MNIQFEETFENPFLGFMYTDYLDEEMNHLGKILEIGFLIFSVQLIFNNYE